MKKKFLPPSAFDFEEIRSRWEVDEKAIERTRVKKALEKTWTELPVKLVKRPPGH